MAQDFWASSGFRLLRRAPEGLAVTPEWLAAFVDRDELCPPQEAGPREQAMHARLKANPLATVAPEVLQSIEDADARDNWREYLRFRDRLLSFASVEACYLDVFQRAAVDLAPPFVDVLAQLIVRGLLDGTDDAWLCRAGELFFRQQRIATEDARVLAADAATLEVFAQTGGFGNLGRLLHQQNTPVPQVKMDVLNHENAPLYFMRDELYSFVLDMTPAGEGARALATVLERWIGHLVGVGVTIEPVARVEDERWRWHVGLDVDSTAILNALYREETVDADTLARIALLFHLRFRDPSEALPELGGRPVYLGIACRPDRTLRLKPQNLILNLPINGVRHH